MLIKYSFCIVADILVSSRTAVLSFKQVNLIEFLHEMITWKPVRKLQDQNFPDFGFLRWAQQIIVLRLWESFESNMSFW